CSSFTKYRLFQAKMVILQSGRLISRTTRMSAEEFFKGSPIPAEKKFVNFDQLPVFVSVHRTGGYQRNPGGQTIRGCLPLVSVAFPGWEQPFMLYLIPLFASEQAC